MSDIINGKPPASFWIIGAVALVWNLIGLAFYYMQVTATEEMLSVAYEDAEVEFIQAIPAWATAGYGAAVTFGVLGCLLLLFRSGWAIPSFIVSLIGILVQDVYGFLIADAIGVFGTGSLVLPLVVLVVAVVLIVYSRGAKAKGWLR